MNSSASFLASPYLIPPKLPKANSMPEFGATRGFNLCWQNEGPFFGLAKVFIELLKKD
jgi:hypothetical protein